MKAIWGDETKFMQFGVGEATFKSHIYYNYKPYTITVDFKYNKVHFLIIFLELYPK